ncbi:glyoxalase/bleomycin resistance protein/dioxygenase superfamily protein [Rhizobium subbaraonis]|uniref:Glyoxalase/bleomycin resistance protein/dioxygenase superfamily protein n=1 Tax=Rhizobium subbaraonis TaxID=908946 RepID=A0A285UPU2_9HYPH|nr:VOC family protein [Rhizobium subbaraonis]SOC42666.1 glyoxalase/bleomycin resistance protein/dioxygenase superfamily protein [Rhizobium subbaraonis]
MRLGRILLYVRDIEETAQFYQRFFGYEVSRRDDDRIVELLGDGGANIMLHPAARGQRLGQSTVKLVFDVEDVDAFCRDSAAAGLQFGPVHRAEGYAFANAKDPSGTPIQVSSRAFRLSI